MIIIITFYHFTCNKFTRLNAKKENVLAAKNTVRWRSIYVHVYLYISLNNGFVCAISAKTNNTLHYGAYL